MFYFHIYFFDLRLDLLIMSNQKKKRIRADSTYNSSTSAILSQHSVPPQHKNYFLFPKHEILLHINSLATKHKGYDLLREIFAISTTACRHGLLESRPPSAGITALRAALHKHDAVVPNDGPSHKAFSEYISIMADAASQLYHLFGSNGTEPVSLPLLDIVNSTNQKENSYPVETTPVLFLTKRQCFSVLCISFFCLWSARGDELLTSESDDEESDISFSLKNVVRSLPSINFIEMHRVIVFETDENSVEREKILMLIEYYKAMCERWLLNDPCLDDPMDSVGFVRRTACFSDSYSAATQQHLIPAVMHQLNESIDHQCTMLRADFANQVIGGAAMSFGCVQEEIMFALCPEMCVARLFTPDMKPDEAIIMLRCEQFATVSPGTYAWTLRFGGRSEPAEEGMRKNLRRQSCVAAIDALDFRDARRASQYHPSSIRRELLKAAAGFGTTTELLRSVLEFSTCKTCGINSPNVVPMISDQVATGNWGCGVFLGDVELKCLVQWIACSAHGKTMHYFPFDNKRIMTQFPTVVSILQGVTINQLLMFLLSKLQKPDGKVGNVFSQTIAFFSTETPS